MAGDEVGLVTGDGVGLLTGDGVGLLAGDADGLLEGVPLGEGVGLGHAIGLAVMGGVVTEMGLGPWFAKYSATGTTIMPTTTASTNVTAPHSRLKNAQLTSREF